MLITFRNCVQLAGSDFQKDLMQHQSPIQTKSRLIEKLPLYEKAIISGTITEMIKFDSSNSLIQNLNNVPNRSFDERHKQTVNFSHTYIESIRRLEKYFI